MRSKLQFFLLKLARMGEDAGDPYPAGILDGVLVCVSMRIPPLLWDAWEVFLCFLCFHGASMTFYDSV